MSTSDKSNKAASASERKRVRNRLVRRSVKTYVLGAKSSASAGEEAAYQKTMLAISSIDKAVSKRVIHRNRGARLKSRLVAKLNKK